MTKYPAQKNNSPDHFQTPPEALEPLLPESKITAALVRCTDHSGAQLSEMTGLGPGSLYPTLIKMEHAGEIESKWDGTHHPRRRRYRINKDKPGNSHLSEMKRPVAPLDKLKLATWAGALLLCAAVWAAVVLAVVR